MTADIVAAVASNMKEDRWVTYHLCLGVVQQDKAQHPLRWQGLIKEWFFHLNNAQAPTADIIQKSMVANKIQLLQYPSYLLDLAPVDFFLFWKVEEELLALSDSWEPQEDLWRGHRKHQHWRVRHCLQAGWTAETSAQHWIHQEISRNRHLLTITVLFLCKFFNLILNVLCSSSQSMSRSR